jgi:hypothetical protein
VHDSAREGNNGEESDKTDGNGGDDLVVLQVSDTGIGISDSLMPSLFTVPSSRSQRLARASVLAWGLCRDSRRATPRYGASTVGTAWGWP